MTGADYSKEPGIALREFAERDVDSGYVEEGLIAFIQSKGLGDECAAFVRKVIKEQYGDSE